MARVFKVVSMSPLPASFVEALLAPYRDEVGGDIRVVSVHGRPRGEVLRELEDADIVIGDYTLNFRIDEEMCRAMKRVRLIQQPSTGYDHIDVEA